MAWQCGLVFLCVVVATCSTVLADDGNATSTTGPTSTASTSNAPTSTAPISTTPVSCRKIDAGVRYFGDLYLFSGDEYVEIDEQNKEVSNGSLADWDEDLPANLDAAVQWTGNYIYYFFKDPNYYRYHAGYGASDPSDAARKWDTFFEGGIDAAGNRNEESYFFKGCNYRKWSSSWAGISENKKLSDIGLPCDIDAAWDWEDKWEDLVLVKGNKVWIWTVDELEGPYQFNDLYTLDSWTLCP